MNRVRRQRRMLRNRPVLGDVLVALGEPTDRVEDPPATGGPTFGADAAPCDSVVPVTPPADGAVGLTDRPGMQSSLCLH